MWHPNQNAAPKLGGAAWPTGVLPHLLLEPGGGHPHEHLARAPVPRTQCYGVAGDKRLKALSQPTAAAEPKQPRSRGSSSRSPGGHCAAGGAAGVPAAVCASRSCFTKCTEMALPFL